MSNYQIISGSLQNGFVLDSWLEKNPINKIIKSPGLDGKFGWKYIILCICKKDTTDTMITKAKNYFIDINENSNIIITRSASWRFAYITWGVSKPKPEEIQKQNNVYPENCDNQNPPGSMRKYFKIIK